MPYNSKGQYVRWGPWLRWKRDKAVYHYGEKLLRLLAKLFYAQSKVGTDPVLDRKHFPFLLSFEDEWQAIEAEVREILKHREAVPLFHEVSPEQAAISKGQNWRTFILYGFGERLEKNCARAPVTARLLSQVPNIQTAWFSIMAPGYKIPRTRV
jgi:aspartyl/asparaginyl beta-hydroxylase (cupin superfamily)